MDQYEKTLNRAEELVAEMSDVLLRLRELESSRHGHPVAPRQAPGIDDLPPCEQRVFQSREVLLRLALVVALFCVTELAVFRSGFYANYLNARSTAGSLAVNIRLEQNRRTKGTNEVLAVGDSRMGVWTRITDRLIPETGYALASIATPGTHPRCWYYMLREVDPDRRRYAAVLIPVTELEDEDWGDWSREEVDVHYLVPLLRLTDTYSFVSSFPTFKLRRTALTGIFLKGLAYAQDFQDLLESPAPRIAELKWIPDNLAKARYDYVGPATTMAGLQVDWAARKITQYPPEAGAGARASLDAELLRPVGNYTGMREAYRRLWFGRIIDYYRGSRTRVIFLRLPRGPVVRPYQTNARSSLVRELAAKGQATLIDEHAFEELEQPTFFMDAMHLNEQGCERFAELLARAVGNTLRLDRTSGFQTSGLKQCYSTQLGSSYFSF